MGCIGYSSCPIPADILKDSLTSDTYASNSSQDQYYLRTSAHGKSGYMPLRPILCSTILTFRYRYRIYFYLLEAINACLI